MTISNDDIDASVGAAFGRPAPVAVESVAGVAKDAFLDAGFCETDADRGVQLLESGHYLGFEDVAISMGAFDVSFRGRNPMVSRQRINEVAARLARSDSGSRAIQERRSATQARPRLVESSTARAVGEALYEACLIDVGEGSSGHYPAATLQDAATSKVFRRGIHCYIDHPSASEELDRPERSVKDLAGCLESDATFRDGGLWAKLRVYSSHREFVAERAGVIGLSIRADGEISEGFGSGKPTISRIAKVHSVDLVTHAGRGGRLVV